MSSTIIHVNGPGVTLTAGTRTSCLPAGSRIPLPADFFYAGRAIKLQLIGRISCAITTPGTARFDLCLGPTGTTIVYDTQGMNLNTAGKTDVAFVLDMMVTCVGVVSPAVNLYNFFGRFMSEAVVGSPLPTVGGSGVLLLSVAGATGPGNLANTVDVFYTQSLATGSLTVTTYQLEAISPLAGAGYNFE